MKKSKLFRALTLCRLPEDPGTRYGYSGGGYEIVQALIESKLFGSFDRAMHELVFSRAGMSSSIFAQPLPIALMGRAVRGHYADGRELAGGWRIVPELAAGGLWSTPTDLAKLLIEIVRAYRGEPSQVISRAAAVDMFTRQNNGPYGLGGAIAGSGQSLALMKRGQNVGYQGYMLIFPKTGQTRLRPRPRGRRALRGTRDFSPRENAAKGSDSVQPVRASGLRAADEISS